LNNGSRYIFPYPSKFIKLNKQLSGVAALHKIAKRFYNLNYMFNNLICQKERAYFELLTRLEDKSIL